MPSNRRRFVRTLLAAAAVAFVLPACAQSTSGVTPVSPPQPTDNPAKIEVIEFFSFGCPHCAEFNPTLMSWKAKQGGDVAFRKVPITFGRAAWVPLAKLYYTLEITGDLERLDSEVFKAVHVDHVNLYEDKTIAEWVAKKGVDPKKFADTFNSFGVMSKLKRGEQLAAAFRIQSVPSLGVEGKFLIGDKTQPELLSLADQVIAKVRSERGGKK